MSRNGSCWDRAPVIGDLVRPLCELEAGHLGAHRAGLTEWMWDVARTNHERARVITELRWLADARKEYETETFPEIAREVHTARMLADILERRTPVAKGGEGFGWMPSWRWEEWDQMARGAVQGEPKHSKSCVEWCNHCQVCGTGIMYGSRCPEHYLNRSQGEPTDAQDVIVQEVARLAGMQLLRRYSEFSDQWWDQLYAGIARVVRTAAATARPIRCDYCGDALPSVERREDIPTTPNLQRLGFAKDKIVCPECVEKAHTNRRENGSKNDA